MKRLWGVRHLRWLWHSIGLEIHLRRWAAAGFMPIAQQSDLDHLDRIWRGER